ncbi:Uncharacterised protein [Pantoea agglomerans]|uniref:Uncharacterized protein n=1 Tax=Enterobacter agglomerans TaxID=549 RepID=A0A379LUB4_ENTAG|nr:Uncharacterised protein [Pantoea agglomerans]
MIKETDRLSQALLRRHGIGVKQKRIHFRGRDLLFQLHNARYEVFQRRSLHSDRRYQQYQ